MAFSFSHISSVRFSGKALGPRLGSVSRMGGVSDVDGDGDGFVTGVDGEDDVPAPIRRVAPEVKDLLSNFADLERRVSGKHGDVSKPEVAHKAIKRVFPNVDVESLDLFPKRNSDGSVRAQDYGRVLLLLDAGDRHPDVAGNISDIRVRGDMVQQMFGGNFPGVFVYGTVTDGKGRPFFAGFDFNPDSEPVLTRDHGWGLRVLADMKDAGFSDDDLKKFYGAYLAAHEFGHAKHAFKFLEKDGLDISAVDDDGLVSNILALYKLQGFDGYDADRVKSVADSFPSIYPEKFKGVAEGDRRRVALLQMLSESENYYFMGVHSRSSLWDDLTDVERATISSREEMGKVSGYAAKNPMEFVAETFAQQLMGFTGGDMPKHWDKMSDWLNKKEASDPIVVSAVLKGVSPVADGMRFALCDGFVDAVKSDKVRGKSELKALGPKLGSGKRPVKPSEVDGDGDGFVTGPSGDDNVPAPVRKGMLANIASVDDLKSWLGKRNESGFVADDFSEFGYNNEFGFGDVRDGENDAAGILRDRKASIDALIERGGVLRPGDERMFSDIIKVSQDRLDFMERGLVTAFNQRQDYIDSGLSRLSGDLKYSETNLRTLFSKYVRQSATVRELNNLKEEFERLDKIADAYIESRNLRLQKMRESASIVGDAVKLEAETRVAKVLASRADLFRNYIIERYGESDAPWKEMTPEIMKRLGSRAYNGDPDAAERLAEWAVDMYSHKSIKGANGRFYEVEVLDANYDDQEIDKLYVAFDIIDKKSGRRVGGGYRLLSELDSFPEVENQELMIDEDHRNSGISSIINQHAFMYAKAAGFKSASVGAVQDGLFVWGKIGFRGDIRDDQLTKLQNQVEKFYDEQPSIIKNADDAAVVTYLLQQSFDKTLKEKERPRHLDYIMAISNSYKRGTPEFVKRQQEIKDWFTNFMPLRTGNFYFDENGISDDPRDITDNKTKSLSVLDLSGVRLVKALGPNIRQLARAGKPSEVDGDGDGFVTGADGQDNVPAPVVAGFDAFVSTDTFRNWVEQVDLSNVSDADAASFGIDMTRQPDLLALGKIRAENYVQAYRRYAEQLDPQQVDDFDREYLPSLASRIARDKSNLEERAVLAFEIYKNAVASDNDDSKERAKSQLLGVIAELTTAQSEKKEFKARKEELDQITEALERKFDSSVEARKAWEKQSREAAEIAGDEFVKVGQQRVEEALKEREQILVKYLNGRYGKDEAPWKAMTPERRQSLKNSETGGEELVEWANQMYSHESIIGKDGLEYRVTANSAYIGGGQLSVSCRIEVRDPKAEADIFTDSEWKYAGYSERKMFDVWTDKPWIYNEALFMQEDNKGAGIATVFNQHAFMYAKAAGFDHIAVSAAQDGPYVWARVGFRNNDGITEQDVKGFSRALQNFDEGKESIIATATDAEIVRGLLLKLEKGEDVRHLDFIMAMSNTKGSDLKNYFLENKMGIEGGRFYFGENMISDDPRDLVKPDTKSLDSAVLLTKFYKEVIGSD